MWSLGVILYIILYMMMMMMMMLQSCDMWSMGVILYIMLCGYPPFYSENPAHSMTAHMRKKIMTGDYAFPPDEWDHISEDAKDIIRRSVTVTRQLWLVMMMGTCMMLILIKSDDTKLQVLFLLELDSNLKQETDTLAKT